MRGKWRAQRADRGAHAARGFLGGAAPPAVPWGCSQPHVSMPHAAFWVVQRCFLPNWLFPFQRFNAARGFVGGATRAGFWNGVRPSVSMPHAALWVVQQFGRHYPHPLGRFQCRTRLCVWCSCVVAKRNSRSSRFNAARGFVSGAARASFVSCLMSLSFQCRTRLCGWCSEQQTYFLAPFLLVSMPHAALWVVQPNSLAFSITKPCCFNAARGFVGGAANNTNGGF